LCGDIFLKRRISAGCSKLEQDSPLFSKHQIDAAAEIIQRKKVGGRQRECERDDLAPYIKATHLLKPVAPALY
jgi:hypothetical protein